MILLLFQGNACFNRHWLLSLGGDGRGVLFATSPAAYQLIEYVPALSPIPALRRKGPHADCDD